MATCPRCKGHLTDNHRCPRRPAVVAAEIVAAGIVGALGGLLVVALFDPNGKVAELDTVSMVGGALLAIALDRGLRRR